VASLTEEVAEIEFDPETIQITSIVFSRRDLRYKCKRCAVFCCKLGGPTLTENDLKRLREVRHESMDFLVHAALDKSEKQLVLKQKDDGSCIFLKYDAENKIYVCNIYDQRPSLCRLYPFEFQRTDPYKGMLRLIPCCNGLNAYDGSLVDGKFVEEHLFRSMMDSIQP